MHARIDSWKFEWRCVQNDAEKTVASESKRRALFNVGQRFFARRSAADCALQRSRRRRLLPGQRRPHVVQLVVQRLQPAVPRARHVQWRMRTAAGGGRQGERSTSAVRRAVRRVWSVRSVPLRAVHRPRSLRHQIRQSPCRAKVLCQGPAGFSAAAAARRDTAAATSRHAVRVRGNDIRSDHHQHSAAERRGHRRGPAVSNPVIAAVSATTVSCCLNTANRHAGHHRRDGHAGRDALAQTLRRPLQAHPVQQAASTSSSGPVRSASVFPVRLLPSVRAVRILSDAAV